jgi:hypothetical protein
VTAPNTYEAPACQGQTASVTKVFRLSVDVDFSGLRGQVLHYDNV